MKTIPRVLSMAIVLVACQSKAASDSAMATKAESTTAAAASAPMDSATAANPTANPSAAAAPSASGAPSSAPSSTSTPVRVPDTTKPRRPPSTTPLPTTFKPTSATVAAILSSDSLVGRLVRVEGRCLGYGTIKATGPSPRTRSDWQLEASGAAIWVTGPLVEGCSATGGSSTTSTLIATVAEDTIPLGPSRTMTPRRYLSRKP